MTRKNSWNKLQKFTNYMMKGIGYDGSVWKGVPYTIIHVCRTSRKVHPLKRNRKYLEFKLQWLERNCTTSFQMIPVTHNYCWRKSIVVLEEVGLKILLPQNAYSTFRILSPCCVTVFQSLSASSRNKSCFAEFKYSITYFSHFNP